MCLGYPALVLEIDGAGGSAVVDDRGRSRRASTLMSDGVVVGDWVLVAAGNVIRRLTPEDAASLTDELARASSSEQIGITPSQPTSARSQGALP